MRTGLMGLVVTAALTGTATVAAPQGADPGVFAAISRAEAPPAYDAAAVRARLDRAQQLGVAGRFRESLREYAAVAKLQKQAGVLPEEALWQVATLQHGKGQRLRAAATLDELAELAEAHGHPVLQARALIEAAVLYQQAHQPTEALTRVERLRPLLASPHLPLQERERIARRILRE